MKAKRRSTLTCLLATALLCGGAGVVFASAEESGAQVYHDPMTNSKVAPDGATYNGFGWDQDMSHTDYCGSGGDSSAFKLDGTNVAYAEYTVSNAESIEALYYFNAQWGTQSHIMVDVSKLDSNRTQYAAWDLPAGDTVVSKFISKSTGLIYVYMNNVWWAYIDTGIVPGGDYSYFNTNLSNFSAPVESDLVPYGAGFQYTLNGSDWFWADKELDVSSKETLGNYNKEVWRAENLPPKIQKVRVYLVDRAVYVTADTSTGTVTTQSPTGSVGWYLTIADVKISYYKNVASNTPPVAKNKTLTCKQSRSVEFELSATDADGDFVNLLFETDNLKGEIRKVSGLKYSYTAPKDEFGTYVVPFRAFDQYDYSEYATLTIVVEESDGGYLPEDLEMTYPQVEELTLHSLFADGMVLQQNEASKIWGLTVPSCEVSVTLKKGAETIANATATADEDGYFSVLLPGQNGSFDKYSVVVSDGTTNKTIENVVYGEVWISSGQSNMELQTQWCLPQLTTVNEEFVRFYFVPTNPISSLSGNYSYTPVYDANGRWGFGNVLEDVKITSGVSYAFALKIYEEMNVPVAIMHTALGATSIATWISRKAIEDDPDFIAEMKYRNAWADTNNWNTFGDVNYNQMTAMFNHKIAPLAGYTAKGIIWYQGCNNVGDWRAATDYKRNLKTLVEDWSYWWGREEDFPLVYTQLHPAEFNYSPSESLSWFNELLTELWTENKTTMAYASNYDVSLVYQGTNFPYSAPCHPITKQPVGERMAKSALWIVYGKDEFEDSIPAILNKMEVKKDKILLTFDYVGEGLKIEEGDEELVGFTICGVDRKFVQAYAKIVSKNQVEVYSPYIKSPVAVAYAFAGMNQESNLMNSQGFPVAAFRTDRVASSYYQPKDWTAADSLDAWIEFSSGDKISGDRTVWQSAPVSSSGATLSVETADKVQGNASIKATYSTGGGGFGTVGFQEREPYDFDPMFGHIEDYKYVSFYLKNLDARDKRVEVRVKLYDGSIYKLLASDGKTYASMAANGEFTEYTFSLEYLLDSSNNQVANPSAKLKNTAAFEIFVKDTEAGSVLVDNVSFFYGVETLPSYTVTFKDGNNGLTIGTQSVEKWATATKIEDPTKEGYVFDGWLNNGEKFDFTTEITEDLILVASWVEDEPENPGVENPGENPSEDKKKGCCGSSIGLGLGFALLPVAVALSKKRRGGVK